MEGEHIKGSPFTVTVKLPVQKLSTPIQIITEMKRPWGVAVNQRGDIIVANYSGHCVSVFSSSSEKLYSFSSHGLGCGNVYCPRGVAVGSDGNILVADGNHFISKFTLDGKFIKMVGEMGSNALEFKRPMGVGVHPYTTQVYVADCENRRIQILNSDLTFSNSFGSGHLNKPWDVAFDSTGDVYVVDRGNHCIQVFTVVGQFMRKFGSEGERNGELNLPTSISIDNDNVVYVTEDGNHRVSVFTCEGKFMTAFGTMGSGPGQFTDPRGIAVDSNGIVIVSDHENNRLQFF